MSAYHFSSIIHRSVLAAFFMLLSTSLISCGGGSSSSSSSDPMDTGAVTYSIGGSLSGLIGTIVLQNNGGDNLTLNTNGSFIFGTEIEGGQSYNVTIASQPVGQVCSVNNASGNVSADVSNVGVTCVTNNYTISGTVTGLIGSVVLENNGTDSVTVTSDGSFTFSAEVAHGDTYDITVTTQPSGLVCSVSNGQGVASNDVTNVSVVCAVARTIGGTVSNLTGTLVLQNNGVDDLAISADGGFIFSSPIADGTDYNVTVATQPTGQTCAMSNGSGTATADVSNISILCTINTYTISGRVSGLTSGQLVLLNNGGDTLTTTVNGNFTFATKLVHGSTYDVTISSQPSGPACSVNGGSGIATNNVSDVQVVCLTTLTKQSSYGRGLELDLAVGGNYAYVAAGSGLDILDITSPTNAIPVSFFPTEGKVLNVAVSGNYAYVADATGGLKIVDVSNPAVPSLAGALGAVNVSKIAISGNYAYLGTSNDVLQIVDISNPASPSIVGAVSGCVTYDVVVSGNYAYIASYNDGLNVIDVSNPAAPMIVGNLPTVSYTKNVSVSGSYAYIGDGLSLKVVDISNPALPTLLGSISMPSPSYDIAVSGNYAYVALYSYGLYVFDISIPTAPASVSTYHVSNTIYTGVAISGNYACLADGSAGGFNVVDVFDPATPTLVSSVAAYAGRVLDVKSNGGYLFVADNHNGVEVIDVSNPIAPAGIARLDGAYWAYGLQPHNNYAYVAANAMGLRVIDITDPLSSNVVSTVNGTIMYPVDVVVNGNYLYAALKSYPDAFGVFDISNPASPVAVSKVALSGTRSGVGVAASGNYAFVAEGVYGLSIVDASDPLNPTMVANLDPGSVADVEISGSYAYLATGLGLEVYDISDPVSPSFIGSLDTAGYAKKIVINGNYAYVADLSAGLAVIDISLPSLPVLVAVYQGVYESANAVAVDNNAIYLAEEGFGVEILQAYP